MGKARDLFQKIGDIKVTFRAKMGTIKDRNGMDLTEAEYVRRDREPCLHAAVCGFTESEKTDQLNWLILIGVRAYKLIKQGDNIQPCCTPFPNWNQSVNPADVSNLICGSSAFVKSSLNIWKFTVHELQKQFLENFEQYFASVWDECNYTAVWAFFGIASSWHSLNWIYLLTDK